MLELHAIDLAELVTALQDQSVDHHHWHINPETGEVILWTEDGGDGQTSIDLDDVDLIGIDPLPSYAWHEDMADFAARVSDERAGRRLMRAIDGKGAFRRFKAELHDEYPDLLAAWYEFRDSRANRRAVEWLVDHSLVADDAAARYMAEHPDPAVP